jgi:glycosyltransferase involved in cell wall biosynthesis
MKICIVIGGLPPFFGGAERRAYRFAQHLQTLPDVQAIVLGWERNPDPRDTPAFPPYVYPVRLSSSPESGSRRPMALHTAELAMRLGSAVWKLRRQFDLLHVINAAPLFNLAPAPFARRLGKPVVIEMTLLGSDDPLKLNRRARHGRRQLFPHLPLKYRLFLQADAYVSKSHGLSEAYRQAGLPESKLHQIPSSVDIQRFRPASVEEKRSLRAKLDLPLEATLIVFVGGIEERKGSRRLLAAYRAMQAGAAPAAPGHPPTHLLIVGPTERFDPQYVQALRQEIQDSGLAEQIHFREGLAENADEYLRAADLFCLPSSKEGLSVAILEAMACGLPVIASDIPEVACSQIENGVQGLLAPVEDGAALAAALGALVADSSRRASLGQAARQRVLDEFTDQAVDRQYLQLYNQLLETRQAAKRSSPA